MKGYLIFLSFVTTFCYAQKGYQYSIPANLDDGWETNSLSAESIDTALFYRFFNAFNQENHKVHSILLIKNQQLLLEEYYSGNSVDTQHDLRSSTKSIRSLLMGIAIDKGFINSENDLISTYLKSPIPQKYLDSRKEKITIKHLLTMSSGLACNDWDKKSKGQEDKVHRKKDWLQYTLDLPMNYSPGDTALYCSMGTVLVAEIISQASGMSIDQFAQKYLFTPLGIKNFSWGHTTKGKPIISSGKRLYMTARDFAKIGLLVMNQGAWNGKQIVSKEWIEKSTTSHTKLSGIDYGFLWWKIPFQYKNEVIQATVATGNGGQYLVLFPNLKLMAVFTGGAYHSPDDKLPFMIVHKVFLPSLSE